MPVKIENLSSLAIGVQGENETTLVPIDVTSWVDEYPEGHLHVLFQKYNASAPSPMVSNYDSVTKILTWVVDAGATSTVGLGYAEVYMRDDDGRIKKSRVIPTVVDASVSGNTPNPPAAYEGWVEQVLGYKDDAEAAQEAAETAQGKAEDAQEATETAQGKAEDAQEAAETAQGKAEEAQAAAEDSEENAEAWAVGQRDGVDVDSSDPTYHNNSKYYSGEASSSATSAAGSAESAAASAAKVQAVSATAQSVPHTQDAGVSVSQDQSGTHYSFSIPRGVPGYEMLDDTAGIGDTDKVWSANKVALLFQAVNQKFALEYDNTDTYAVRDLSIHENVLYRCTTAISTAEDWTAAHWTATTMDDELEALATEIKNRFLMPSAAFAIPASGNSVDYDMDGLTADHELIAWKYSASAENSPPASLDWTTHDGHFVITNSAGTTAENICPIFVKPTKKTLSAHVSA